uniref:Uncharacterized protein n=1 Tax=Rhizophora mucronata TaxID=61149 RepID=A0A2P2MXU1_RHIMU
MHENSGRWILPCSRVLYPSYDINHTRDHVNDPKPIGAHLSHAEGVRV